MLFKGENILLGVTGGIAAYKAVELCRLLVKEGAGVRVVMTKNACLFVTPLTFKTVSNNQVYTDLFMPDQEFNVRHVSLAGWPDIIVVAPATANTIARFALGLADDLLSTLFLARGDQPVYIAPAMNDRMYHNAVVQKNIAGLKQQGINIIEGGTGELACGEIGSGRMAEPQDIVAEIARSRSSRTELKGKKVLVTAGPTREPLDPVRFLSNYSSGKMGYALAGAARERGATVTLISGPAAIDVPAAIKLVHVETARDMYEAVLAFAPEADIIIKAAAVSDYRPVSFSEQKIKKGADLYSLT
ncbi:MAG TPA: bifunctional phosphopantothenoylcysteine decarboxylase/phosphopantothenate--cysteine ligase CoaBC, partial [Firmicutes bacterium]|nr:bifunctional phosphopantothenoylcysteine decarboxylase/phosphopantothenate--cysteine ligase CoaBC [Bacillota bacterium]